VANLVKCVLNTMLALLPFRGCVFKNVFLFYQLNQLPVLFNIWNTVSWYR